MKYRSVIAPRRGSPEVLEVVENDLRPPRKGEARIRVLAASVSLPDVEARYGRSPFPPKLPFTPGYSVVGEIEAVGQNGMSPYQVGDRVAALTVYGGYSEMVYFPVRRLIPVPAALDSAQVVPLILNYIVAYQAMPRVAKVEAGQTALTCFSRQARHPAGIWRDTAGLQKRRFRPGDSPVRTGRDGLGVRRHGQRLPGARLWPAQAR